MAASAALLSVLLVAGCAPDDTTTSTAGGDLGDGGKPGEKFEVQTITTLGRTVTLKWFQYTSGGVLNSGVAAMRVALPEAPDKKIMSVKVVVRANEGDGFGIFPGSFALIGPDGTKYLPSSTGTLKSSIYLSPGQRTEGTVDFDSPPDLKGATVEYNPGSQEGEKARAIWK